MGPQRSEKTRKSLTVVLSSGGIVAKGVRVCLPRMQKSQDLESKRMPSLRKRSVEGCPRRSCISCPCESFGG